jgi:hypothetical protein
MLFTIEELSQFTLSKEKPRGEAVIQELERLRIA